MAIRKIRFLLFIILAIVLSVSPCFSGNKTQAFRILTEEFPPYNYTSDDGKILGISTEIVREILKRTDHPDNIEVMPWADGYRRAQEEDRIILFSTTRSLMRENLFKWVGPLVPNNLVFFARKNSGIAIDRLEEAKKMKAIGVYKDDFGELLLKEKGFNNLDAVLENRQNLPKLLNGEIDLWIANELTGKHMISQARAGNKIEKIYEVQKNYMYLAFSKSTSDEVIEEWQRGLDELKSDGTYAQIFSQWIMFSYTEDLGPQVLKNIELTTEERTWLADHPVVQVATDPDYAPFQFQGEDGASKGVADDYLKLLGQKLGVRFEPVTTESWAESLSMVKNLEADLVAVAAPTTERREYMHFTAPYLEFPDVIITRTGHPKVSSLDDLAGKTVASVKGFAINKYLAENHPDITVILAPDVKGALQSVALGEADVSVMNIATTSYTIEKWKITNLRISGMTDFSYQLAFGSRKDWPVLNRILDKALAAVSDEEKNEILRKWIAISFDDKEEIDSAIAFTKDERQWLNNHPVILAASDPKWPPIDYFDAEGTLSGIAADYMALIEKRLGIQIKVVPQESWTEALISVRDRQVSMLPAAVRTPERDQYLLFTKPYLELPAVIIVNNETQGISSMADLRGLKVGVIKDYGTHDFLKRGFPYLDIVPVPDIKSGLYDVSYGKTDAFIANIAVASWYIEKKAIQNLRLAGDSGYVFELGIASRSDWLDLHYLLEKGLASITEEERHAIYRKWIGLKSETWKPTREQLITFVVLLVGMGFGIVLVWNRQLRNKVRTRTEEVRAANRAKSEFLAIMSHEIRSPMNAITNLTDLACKSADRQKQKEYLRLARDSADGLLVLVNDILDITKIEKGKMEVDLVAFDLIDLVRRTMEPLSFLAARKGLEFHEHIDSRVPRYLLGAPDMLRQILTNLLGNAVKFTPQGSVGLEVESIDEVGLRSEENRLTIRFVVRDTGIGIPAEQQEKIFENFTQADSSTTRKYGGSGLGTTIAKQLVELMGGEISLASVADRGSVFTFTVSFTKADENAVKGLREQVPSEGMSRQYEALRILLVEDNLLNSYVAAEALAMFGQNVTSVADGKECLTMLAGGDYDLILMDVMMPEMDGYEATRRIREREKKEGSRIPIIALTASAFKEDKNRCLEAGMDDYLAKPVNFDLLMEKICTLTGISATIQEKTTSSADIGDGAASLYDLSLLQGKIGADEAKLKELLSWFVKDTSQQIEAAEQELAAGKTEQVVKSCHKIRGSAESLGAEGLKKWAEEAQKSGEAKNLDDSKQNMKAVKASFASIAEELARDFKLTV